MSDTGANVLLDDETNTGACYGDGDGDTFGNGMHKHQFMLYHCTQHHVINVDIEDNGLFVFFSTDDGNGRCRVNRR